MSTQPQKQPLPNVGGAIGQAKHLLQKTNELLTPETGVQDKTLPLLLDKLTDTQENVDVDKLIQAVNSELESAMQKLGEQLDTMRGKYHSSN